MGNELQIPAHILQNDIKRYNSTFPPITIITDISHQNEERLIPESTIAFLKAVYSWYSISDLRIVSLAQGITTLVTQWVMLKQVVLVMFIKHLMGSK